MEVSEQYLLILGTAGGSTTWTSTDTWVKEGKRPRHGTSSVLVVRDHLYIVDFGIGSSRQLAIADPLERGRRRVLADVRAMFVTHLHADHILDLPEYLVCGDSLGWPDVPVPVFGPKERVTKGGHVVRGISGTIDAIEGFLEADSVGRNRVGLPCGCVAVEIEHDSLHEDGSASPSVGPIEVYRDNRVHVTATLVEHGSMFPAFAYRFDTDTSSVVFSGDTAPSESLIALSSGAEVLVHEVIDDSFRLQVAGEPPYSHKQKLGFQQILAKHTNVRDVGRIAERCGVKKLVLNHLVPANMESGEWKQKVSGFRGEVIVGEDLMRIALGQ